MEQRGRLLAAWLGGLALSVSMTATMASAATSSGPSSSSTSSTTSSTTSSSTSSTTGPVTTAPPTTGSPDPTVPTSITSSTASSSTTSSTLPPPTSAPGPEPTPPPTPPTTAPPTTPTTLSTIDPLIDEGPGGDVPETDHTVPDRGYGGQGDFPPPVVLWSGVRDAEAALLDAATTRDAARAELDRAIGALALLRGEQRHLDRATLDTLGELEAAQNRLQDRAIAAFLSADELDDAMVATLGRFHQDGIIASAGRVRILRTIMDADERALADYRRVRESLDDDVLDAADAIVDARHAVAAARADLDEAERAVDEAADELATFEAGSAVYIDDVVFPVAPGYGYPLIDSWGFPRMPGTPDEHWHEGIDIFAPAGTPLVAAERSVVSRVGSGRLGGLVVWLQGESGAHWYYAHLLAHAPGLAVGQVLAAGDVIGYVGNTGNAVGTPPHLHLQLHPDGGRPVNPYPLLNQIAARDRAAATGQLLTAIDREPGS